MELRRLVLPLQLLAAFGSGVLATFGAQRFGAAPSDPTGPGAVLILILAVVLAFGCGIVGLLVGLAARGAVRGLLREMVGVSFRGHEPAGATERTSSAEVSTPRATPREDRERGPCAARSPNRLRPEAGSAPVGATPPPELSSRASGDRLTSTTSSRPLDFHSPRPPAATDGSQDPYGSVAPPSRTEDHPDPPTSGRSPSPPSLGEPANEPARSPSWEVQPHDLIPVWEHYEAEGDGHFTATGLGRHLDEAGIDARVVSGDELGLDDTVLGVAPPNGSGPIYLLPHINRPPAAVSAWFEDQGAGVRTAPIRRLLQVAEVERRGGRLDLVQKGIVA